MKRLAVPGAILLAFVAGWWVGRTSTLVGDMEERVARLERELDSVMAHVAQPASGPDTPSRGPDPGRVHPIEIGDAPSVGRDDAPVTIVEFADFECAFCASAVATLEKVIAEYPDDVRWVFKHHPMPFHRRALLAHKAALAAAAQGKFWEMHALLFASQDRLDRESLAGHARSLALDLESFEAALGSPEAVKTIQRDAAEAQRLGVLGVPSFFINGRFLAGAQPYEVFRERIERELQNR